MKKCIVIAQNGETRDFLATSLKSKGIDAVLLTSLGELIATLEAVPVCGILLDLTVAITATVHDKKATQEFLDLFPFAKFRLVGDQVTILGDTLDGIVSKCQQFESRVIRKAVRIDKHFAIDISANKNFKDAEKSTTINVSTGGYFVYSTREWSVGSRIYLKFLDDGSITSGTVRWTRPWSNNKLLPGIGIKIDED